MAKKILNRWWFAVGPQLIGIVVTENEVGEKKAYIKTFANGGSDEEADAVSVAQTGAKVSPALLREILAELEPQQKQ